MVSRRLVEVFENVQAKQTVVVVEDLTRLEVEVNVPERDILARSAGNRGYTFDEMQRVSESVQPTITISAIPDREFSARITEIATQADPSTRTFAVRLAFDLPEDVGLLPGMTSRVRGRFNASGSIYIPLSALASTPEGKGKVWIIDPGTMTAQAREITLGEMNSDQVQVLSGLLPGEMIATTGATLLAEGMQVSRFESRRQ